MGALALKVDVDTYRGTLEGVPRLLDLFAKEGVRATFYFCLGPDRTGVAVKRVFRKGFVRKVLSASPASSYGIRTMLYGTLLPAPDIGRKPAAVRAMRAAREAGHPCGIHGWDHVGWHDRAASMTRGEAAAELGKAADRFADVFGERATLSAAPGWTATPVTAEVEEAAGIRLTSDSRGGSPFRPARADGSACAIVEIPSTLPTLDELLAWDEFRGAAKEGTVEHLARAVREADGLSVHSIHTEIEGGRALHALFARQVRRWKDEGVAFVTIPEAAAPLDVASLPVRRHAMERIAGRALPVAVGR